MSTGLEVHRQIWSRILETYPDDWNTYLWFEIMPRKNTYEVHAFFEDAVQGAMRVDCEMSVEAFANSHWYNWSEEDVNMFVDNVRLIIEKGLHGHQKG